MNLKNTFAALHKKEQPLTILNIWDTESSLQLYHAGVAVCATSSYALSSEQHVEDGENIKFTELIAMTKTIQGHFISVDIEAGYAHTLAHLEQNIHSLLKMGIAGINIEDKLPNTTQLIEVEQQLQRLQTIKKADKYNQLFINARTDLFFYGDIEAKNKDAELLADAITLGHAYAEAGADCFFVPGLKNKKFLETLASSIQIPINIMLDISQDHIEDYTQLGIARISYGPFIYLDYKKSTLELTHYFTKLIQQFKQLEAKSRITLSIDGVE